MSPSDPVGNGVPSAIWASADLGRVVAASGVRPADHSPRLRSRASPSELPQDHVPSHGIKHTVVAVLRLPNVVAGHTDVTVKLVSVVNASEKCG